MAFWRMLKQGYDHFEVSRLEPKVNVCEKRYVFDAEGKVKFDPIAKCPAFTVNDDLVAAVKEKQQNDDRQMAELVSKGTPTVPVRAGKDGGMHDVFLATMKPAYTDAAGIIRTPWATPLPGTIPAHATAPGDPKNPAVTVAGVPAVGTTYVRSPPPGPPTLQSVVRVADPTPSVARAQEPAPSAARAAEEPTGNIGGDPFRTGRVNAQTATAQPSSSPSSFFGSLFSNEPAPQPSTRGIEPAAKSPPPKPAAPQLTAARPATANAGAIRPAAKPEATATVKPDAQSRAAENNVLPGAQPTMPSGGFENRFGAWR
jgi:hypothetical protein